MAKDYGNRQTSRRRNNGPHQFLVVVLAFGFGYLFASFADIDSLKHWMNKQVLAAQESTPQPAKPEAQRTQQAPKPKFEFYTLLANEKVPSTSQANTTQAQPSATNKAISGPTTPTKVTTTQPNPSPIKVAEGKPLAPEPVNKNLFSVQVASFKAQKDAEHLKGSLILKGYGVRVVPVSQAQGNWFRVVVGPYSTKAIAQHAQLSLAKNERLNGMIKSGA